MLESGEREDRSTYRGRTAERSAGICLNHGSVASCVVSWSLRFAEPIVLKGWRQLVTLREAINRNVERVFDPTRKDPH
jgi:hypothetical protein